MMSLQELNIRRAQIRLEFDALNWRYKRLGQRLDALAGELDTLDVEIAAEKMRREVPPEWSERAPLRMEIV